MNSRAVQIAHLGVLVEATAVFLCLYQALRVLFSVLFGVIYDALFAEKVSMAIVGLLLVAVIVALLAPLAAPRRLQARRVATLVSAILVFVARIPLTLNEPRVRLAASILIVAASGIYLATRLRSRLQDVVHALILALAVDQLLRTAGHTWDVTMRPEWWPGQVAISLILCLLAGWLFHKQLAKESETTAHVGLLGGLAWGSWLFLETSLLNSPNALARWTSVPYTAVAPLLLATTLLPLLLHGMIQVYWHRFRAAADLALLLLCLVVGNLMTGSVALLLMLVAQWIMLRLLLACFSPDQSGQGKYLSAGLALGGVVFLVLSFAYAFAFTYPYTLDLFHKMGLPIILVAGLLTALPGLRSSGIGESASLPPRFLRLARWTAGTILVLATVAMVWPAQPPPAKGDALRFATYNIHYGYDTDWHLSLEAQAQTIEASGADVVMLQEVDTGRPTSYMIDNALWLARRLGMEAVYLPTVEYLTGIALLSRYPVVNTDRLLLPSELEQTGILWAQLDVEGQPVNAFATWLGLEPDERARQIDAALPFIAAHPGPAAFGGDFNATPDSPIYAHITGAGFVDPFPALGLGSPPTDPGIDPTKRIDFVWLRDLAPTDARVLDSIASDHRLVLVEAGLP